MSEVSHADVSISARRERFYRQMAAAEMRLQADADLLARHLADRDAWLTPDLDCQYGRVL